MLDQPGHEPSTVLGCNLSAATFSTVDKWNDVLKQLRARFHLLPRFVIELTETRALQDLGRFSAIVSELRKLGCRIALGDFGTGYACPRLLQMAELGIVKIDKTFLRDVRSSGCGGDSLWHLISLASRFAPIVVVEGLETAKQTQIARNASAMHLQDYLFSRSRAFGSSFSSEIPAVAR